MNIMDRLISRLPFGDDDEPAEMTLDQLRHDNARLSRLLAEVTAQREAALIDREFYYRLYLDATRAKHER